MEAEEDRAITHLIWELNDLLNPGFPGRENWGDRRGLNPRPWESQSHALPTELRPPLDS